MRGLSNGTIANALNDLEGHIILLFETFISPYLVKHIARIYKHSASRGSSTVAELLVEILRDIGLKSPIWFYPTSIWCPLGVTLL